MIGGANDYQLGLNPGGHVSESIESRAHVTFDGGKTWSMFPLFSNSAYQATGDPAVAFDALATLTTPRWASASSARSTPRIPTSWSPTLVTAARPGT